MRELRPTVSGDWTIVVGQDARELLLERVEAVDPDKVLIVLDRTVESLHLETVLENLPHACPSETVVFNEGEENKNLATLEHVAGDLMRAGAGPRSLVLNVGGAATLHMGGLAASLLHRGVRFANVATTFYAQWRAINSRRHAVHFVGESDALGVWRDPEFAIADPHFSETEEERSVRAGLAEVVRDALLLGGEFHDRARKLLGSIDVSAAAGRAGALEVCVEHSLRLGAVDPDESRLGAFADYGRPVARALERLADGRLLPGEALHHAMRIVGEIARASGILSATEYARHRELLALAAPADAPFPAHVRTDRLVYKLHGNNKTERDGLRFMLLDAVGSIAGGDSARHPVSDDDVARATDAVRAEG